MQILLVLTEVDDRIADQLARPVKRGVAAALDLEQLHAASGQQRRVGEEMLGFTRATERDDRVVLDEEQRVRARAGNPFRGDGPLQLEHLAIAATAEVL